MTRGRANSLRLAITGQLGEGAFCVRRDGRDHEALRLLQGLPARMPDRRRHGAHERSRFRAARAAQHGLSLHDRLVGYLPRYAGLASRLLLLLNRRNDSARLAKLAEKFTGFAAQRKLPRWRTDRFRDPSDGVDATGVGGDAWNGRSAVLFADTFNRYFEPENIEAALRVLASMPATRCICPSPLAGTRPLCCGRTFLSVRAGRGSAGGGRAHGRSACSPTWRAASM